MKKIKLLVATLAIAALAIGLCACSCSGSVGKTDFGWYKAAVPQGFTDVKESGNVGQKFVNDNDKDQIIKVYKNSTTSTKANAAAAKADRISKDPEKYKDKGQIKMGKYNIIGKLLGIHGMEISKVLCFLLMGMIRILFN